MSSDSHTTKDHNVIRDWAEKRGGHPATVATTETGHEAGILRLDFDPPDASLDPISWEQFFEKFDDAHLSFLYQDKTVDGCISRFHKFIRE